MRKFGPLFNCWSVPWAIWLWARTAIIWSGVFISDGGLARAASRTVTCGVESGPRCFASAKSLSTRSRRMCWLLILLLNWLLTPNELADAFAEKGALLHEVPIDVVRAVSEADFLAVRIEKQLYTTAIQAVPELKGAAKAPGSREARRLALPQLMAATDHDLLRDPLKLQGLALLSLRTHD